MLYSAYNTTSTTYPAVIYPAPEDRSGQSTGLRSAWSHTMHTPIDPVMAQTTTGAVRCRMQIQLFRQSRSDQQRSAPSQQSTHFTHSCTITVSIVTLTPSDIKQHQTKNGAETGRRPQTAVTDSHRVRQPTQAVMPQHSSADPAQPQLPPPRHTAESHRHVRRVRAYHATRNATKGIRGHLLHRIPEREGKT